MSLTPGYYCVSLRVRCAVCREQSAFQLVFACWMLEVPIAAERQGSSFSPLSRLSVDCGPRKQGGSVLPQSALPDGTSCNVPTIA